MSTNRPKTSDNLPTPFKIDHFDTCSPTSEQVKSFRKRLQEEFDIPHHTSGRKLCAMLASTSAENWRSWERGRRVPTTLWVLARMRANLLLNPHLDDSEFHEQMNLHLRILQKAAKQILEPPAQ